MGIGQGTSGAPADSHDGVITHQEQDILECEVKWALGNITTNKASGGDGIPAERFQILKDDVVKVLHSICEQIWKTQQWPQDWKRSVFIPIPKKGNAKECSNYCTVALISQASKVPWRRTRGSLRSSSCLGRKPPRAPQLEETIFSSQLVPSPSINLSLLQILTLRFP